MCIDTEMVSHIWQDDSDMNEREIVPFGLRVPAEVMDWVRRKAEQQERSMNWVINRVLREAKDVDEQKEAA